MKFIETEINSLFVIKFEPFYDERGKFTRVFCKNEFKEIGHSKDIVQINHSLTKKKGSVRGMHFQYSPKSEIKIIKCIKGAVFDVAVDIRENSSTFLKWYSEILSSKNMKGIYIPEGFAHGFQTLESNTELIYFHTEYYDPEYEAKIKYDDPKLNIIWPLNVKQMSKSDKDTKFLNENFKGIKV